MTDHRIDWDREARTGTAEAVLCDVKTAGQIAAILTTAQTEGRRLLLTRLEPDRFAALPDMGLDYGPLSRTAILGGHAATLPGVGIVAAGTSDLAIAAEAARTLAFHGYAAPVTADVGVAGLHRLLDRLDELRRHRVLIAVAGMEGALFSVLAGLVAAPVIAVPAPHGYGVAKGGRLALHSALGSCAQGVVAVNIGNGFGAACVALRILKAGSGA
ncbi:MAG: nickel pincer cofactor biosynthesis protein LarB [Pseudorhodobacter sp.]